MKVLVVGGAGYIGSHVVAQLVRRGDEVTVLDNLTKGHSSAIPSSAKLVVGDVRDSVTLDALMTETGFDAVMHFAACIEVGESTKDPILFYENNVCGTINLVKAMVKHEVKRLVFSSTAATYGEPIEIPITEEHPTAPKNPYGETKLAVEKALRWCEEAYGLRSVCLRYFNASGADADGHIGESHSPESHLIPLVLFAAMKKRQSITIFGDDYPTPDGTCIRDYIHVTDLADAHLLAADFLITVGKSDVFNLGNGIGFSNKQILKAAEAVTGVSIPHEYGQRRLGDPAVLVASSAKAKEILGWQPRYPEVETIIETAWRFHKSHPDGLK